MCKLIFNLKNLYLILIFTVGYLFSPFLHAEENPQAWPLYFPAHENGIELSPPKIFFEQTRSDWLVGDVLIGEDSFSVRQSTASSNRLSIEIKWKADLLNPSYVILLFDQAAIKSQTFKISPADVKAQIYKKELSKDEHQHLLKMCLVEEGNRDQRLLCYEPALKVQSPQWQTDQGKKIISNTSLEIDHYPFVLQHLQNQLLYQIYISPVDFELHEVVSKGGDILQVVAFGQEPIGEIKKLQADQSPLLQKTIGDLRHKFGFELSRRAPYFSLKTEQQFSLVYEIKAQNIPDDDQRLYFLKRPPNSFASSSVDLRLVVPEKQNQEPLHLASKQNEFIESQNIWRYQLKDKYNMNHAEIHIYDPGSTTKSESSSVQAAEIYRGANTYLTLGLGLTANAKGEAAGLGLGEVAYWPSEILGWSNDWFSRRRWGISANAAQTGVISSITDNYRVSEYTLNYRLTPGIPDWDESLILQLGLINWQYQGARDSQFLGAGLKYSRSLPAFFEPLFSYLPFFRNPKWAEISYRYSNSARESGQSGETWVVQGLGRIQINPSFYFEGGWSFSKIEMRDQSVKKAVEFAASRGYLAFGARF